MADEKNKEEVKPEEKVYKVIKPWGKHILGEILKTSREVRRKLEEGGCLEETTMSAVKKERDDAAKKAEAETSKNKMQKDTAENKGAK